MASLWFMFIVAALILVSTPGSDKFAWRYLDNSSAGDVVTFFDMWYDQPRPPPTFWQIQYNYFSHHMKGIFITSNIPVSQTSISTRLLIWIYQNVPMVDKLIADPTPPPPLTWTEKVTGYVSEWIELLKENDYILPAIQVAVFAVAAIVVIIVGLREYNPVIYKLNRFGTYKLIKQIGEGGNSVVYAARSKKNFGVYALKITKKGKIFSSGDGEYIKAKVKKSLLEVETWRMCNGSSHIVPILSTFQTKLHLVMVMPIFRAGTLRDQLILNRKNSGFTESELKYFVKQIIMGLQFLHSNKIIHNDIKPENMLVAAGGQLQLTDFGSAFLGVEIGKSYQLISAGTPGFMAPEALGNLLVGTAVDYWSLGATIYWLHNPPLLPFGQPEVRLASDGTIKFIGDFNAYVNIVTAQAYEKKDTYSEEFYQFIYALLIVEAKERLGHLNSPHGEILDHAWLILEPTGPRYIPTDLDMYNDIDDHRLEADLPVLKKDVSALDNFKSIYFPEQYFKHI